MRVQGISMNDKKSGGKVKLSQGVLLKVFDHSLAEPDHGNSRAFTVILQCKKINNVKLCLYDLYKAFLRLLFK